MLFFELPRNMWISRRHTHKVLIAVQQGSFELLLEAG
jgi:hypothetical protein